MKRSVLGVLCSFLLVTGNWQNLAEAQTVRGKNIRTHTIYLNKKDTNQGKESIKPVIGFLAWQPYKKSDPHLTSAYDFLSRLSAYQTEYILFQDLIKHPKRADRFSLIWIHHTDTTDLASEKFNPSLIKTLQTYVSNGGNLFLTQEAFHYINALGLETQIPADSTKSCIDDGYGRKLGFHAFRDHPVFNGLNGGAYVVRPKKDITCRITGFFGNNMPKQGKVVAVDWDYIFVREDSRLIMEYNCGSGKVIAVGAYIDFTLPNLNQEHLELFTRNILDFLVGNFENQKKWYWDYSPDTVMSCGSRPQTDQLLAAIPESRIWKVIEDPLMISKRYASENFYDVAGERLLTMGRESGGIDEVWSHPFMAFRDYEVGIRFGYRDTIYWLNDERPQIQVHPGFFLRQYKFPRAYLKEILVVDPVEPSGIIHYEYEGVYEAELIIRFKTNFRWMWPYSEKVTGSICHSWNPDMNAFLFQDKSKDLNLFIGGTRKPSEYISGRFEGFAGGKSGKPFTGKPTRLLQASALLRYSLSARDDLDIVYSATCEGYSVTCQKFDEAIHNTFLIFDHAISQVRYLLLNRLMITSPDENFNKGYRWALIGTNRFYVNTPGMGKSLVAGYSTTRRGWNGGHQVSGRPGYGWYFGRDGEWSGFALLDYGDFDKVRSCLEFFNKYQDLTGKIFHEATTSGFIHYDAADATPLYIVLAGKYFRHTNDTVFLRKTWLQIKKAINYCFSTDTDRDHLIENTNVGHGWVEGGELYGSHATLYLTGSWTAALTEARDMASFIGDPEAGSYQMEAKILRNIINTDFWNGNTRFFSYGMNRDRTFRHEPTVLPAVPMYFQLADKDKAEPVLKQYASNAFTTNWGTRIVREDSPYFNPRGYHYGSVWPLFTGWTSLAEYANGNHIQGFSHLMDNLNVYKNWGLGFVEEVLNGSEYQPSGVCPHQCWSETMVLQPAIEGMLGLDIRSQENKIRLSPRLPADWDSLRVENIRMADKWLDFNYNRETGKVKYLFHVLGGAPINLEFMPVFPAGTLVTKVQLNGKDLPFTTFTGEQALTLFVRFEINGYSSLQVFSEKGISALPVISDPRPGYPSSGLRILSSKFSGNEYSIELEGESGTNEIVLIYVNSQEIEKIVNGTLKQKDGHIYSIAVDFPPSVMKYTKQLVRLLLK